MSTLAASLRISLEALDEAALAPVDVAIVDSGIDATHPDLAARVARAWRIEPGEDGKTIAEIPLERGYENDSFGHGTGVAGIVARLAPNARLHDIRVLNAGNRGSAEALVRGLRLAVRERIPVINMSLAAPAKIAPELAALCERAWYQGQLVIAAKRNVPISDDGFPAEFSACIGVDTAEFPSPYSFRFRDRGRIEIVALGENVPTTGLGHGYTSMTGTSFATPTITGLCARLLGAFPGLKPFEVRAILRALAV
jgi:subtilisin family serine protease